MAESYWKSNIDTSKSTAITYEPLKALIEKPPSYQPRVYAVSQREFDLLVEKGYINKDGSFRGSRRIHETGESSSKEE